MFSRVIDSPGVSVYGEAKFRRFRGIIVFFVMVFPFSFVTVGGEILPA
jgi:hypothetical protein